MKVDPLEWKNEIREIVWHELRTWPEYFEAILQDKKFFELRENDRDFHSGDYLILNEWDPIEKEYTGRVLSRRIVGLLEDEPMFGLMEGHCIMSIEKV